MKRMLTVVIGSIALVGCAEQASADVTVYGSVEQALTITDNGTTNSKDITNGDTYIGFKATEDLGNGLSAFGDISLNIDSEAHKKKLADRKKLSKHEQNMAQLRDQGIF